MPTDLAQPEDAAFAQSAPTSSHLHRWVLAIAGVICVAIAAVGVVVPGLPTTVFLILASWLFARSCPWLEQRLIRNRLFAPYATYLDGDAVMPLRAKVVTLALMWSCIGVSLFMLADARAFIWLAVAIVAAGAWGTAMILRQGRRA